MQNSTQFQAAVPQVLFCVIHAHFQLLLCLSLGVLSWTRPAGGVSPSLVLPWSVRSVLGTSSTAFCSSHPGPAEFSWVSITGQEVACSGAAGAGVRGSQQQRWRSWRNHILKDATLILTFIKSLWTSLIFQTLGRMPWANLRAWMNYPHFHSAFLLGKEHSFIPGVQSRLLGLECKRCLGISIKTFKCCYPRRNSFRTWNLVFLFLPKEEKHHWLNYLCRITSSFAFHVAGGKKIMILFSKYEIIMHDSMQLAFDFYLYK